MAAIPICRYDEVIRMDYREKTELLLSRFIVRRSDVEFHAAVIANQQHLDDGGRPSQFLPYGVVLDVSRRVDAALFVDVDVEAGLLGDVRVFGSSL